MTANQGADDTGPLVRRLIEAGQRLPDETRRDVLALGAAGVPMLLEILEDDALAVSGSPGEGYAPVHAARLLGELRAAEAAEPLVRALADTDPLDVLHDQVIQSLSSIGAPAVEPALRAAANAGRGFLDSLAGVLASAGTRDERIFELLVAQLRSDPTWAGNLADYGDPRALPHLSQALDAYQLVQSEYPLANHDLIEIREAIERLGGTLTPAQQLKCRRGREPADVFRRKLDAALKARRRVDQPDKVVGPVAPHDRPGRNHPCWCGSGKKYKRCHLSSDEGTVRPGSRPRP